MILANVGDTVHITASESPKWAGNYKVIKINPTTYQLKRESDGALLKAGHGLVTLGALPTVSSIGTPYVPTEFFEAGTVVTFKNSKVDPNKLWVVTGQTGKGYRIFPLGGSARYYTGIPANRLTRVTEISDWQAA